MPRYAIKLKFTSPLHIGLPGIGAENCTPFIPSDTLFSGLIHSWALRHTMEETSESIKEFQENPTAPPFRISSAFLYRDKDAETVYYLPKPRLPLDEWSREAYGEILKDMDFIPHYFFNQWIEGIADVSLLDPDSQKKEKIKLKAHQRLYEESISFYLASRNELDRPSLASTIYQVGLVSFDEEAGLYFLLEIEEEKLAEFTQTLSLLGERGLGGERSTGCGQFEVVKKKENNFLEEVTSPDAYCSLSLVHPREKDIEAVKGYALIRRSGFVSSPYFGEVHRKLPCRMLAEGSVFRRPIPGELVEVTPAILKHPIYRYGLAFMVGARTK